MQKRFDNEFAPDLLSGETLLWTGQPRQGIFLQASDAVVIPFSILLVLSLVRGDHR